MEAKGCAKPAVWKNARRRFYWAVRARVARSSALAMISEASPGTTLEYRSRLLDSMASIEPTTDHREMAEKIEHLDLSKTLAQLKIDYLMRSLLDVSHLDRKAAMDGLLRLVDNLSEDERMGLKVALQTSSQSPGTPTCSCSKLPLMYVSRSPIVLELTFQLTERTQSFMYL